MSNQFKCINRFGIICFILMGFFLFCGPDNVIAQDDNSESRTFPVPEITFSPKQYVVYKTPSTITVDGKINEEVWEKAPWTDFFVDAKGGATPAPKYATKVKILWDNDYLYVAAQLEDPHLWGKMKKRDMPLYLDNAFEIFIDPDKDTHNYVEFEINARGTIWDLYLTKPYRDGGQGLSDYNLLDYQSGVHLNGKINEPKPTDKGWTLEYAIPLDAILQLDPNRQSLTGGDQWKVNFQRAQRRLKVVNGNYELAKNPDTGKPFPPDFWVWSPQGLTDIHYPEMWGVVQFSESVVGQEKVSFNTDPSQKYRWVLRKLYYQMKEYQLNNGRFPDGIKLLNLSDISLDNNNGIDLNLQATRSLFEISLSVQEGHWHIDQSGRLWKD